MGELGTVRSVASTQSSRQWSSAIPLRFGKAAWPLPALFLLWHGCDRASVEETKLSTPVEETRRPLNVAPKIEDFVLQAQNSIRLQTGGLVVAGGDIGAFEYETPGILATAEATP